MEWVRDRSFNKRKGKERRVWVWRRGWLFLEGGSEWVSEWRWYEEGEKEEKEGQGRHELIGVQTDTHIKGMNGRYKWRQTTKRTNVYREQTHKYRKRERESAGTPIHKQEKGRERRGGSISKYGCIGKNLGWFCGISLRQTDNQTDGKTDRQVAFERVSEHTLRKKELY